MSAPRDVYADIECQVVHRDGRVHLLFSRRVEGELRGAQTDHMVVDPPSALAMAEVLAAMAFEADTKLKPVGDVLKADLVESHRKKLGPRVALIVRSGINERIGPERIGRQVLDAIFSEVFS